MNEKQKSILDLKKEKDAIILAHYYQIPEIQDVADFLGDSLALAQAAKVTDAKVIVFCGVHFMAETAKILNPNKIVLLPDMGAGCSLADSCPVDKFKEWKIKHLDGYFISYINCSTEIKALSDVICTSASAEKIVKSIPDGEKICFAPDKNLGGYISKKLNRPMELWDGGCHVHLRFSEKDLLTKMKENKYAVVLAHPECPQNIRQYADYIGSTTGIIDFASKCESNDFIVLTETGVIHQMKKNNPHKNYITVEAENSSILNDCEFMKKITLDNVIQSLETLEPQIHIDEALRLQALKPLEKMLEISK